MMRQFCISHVAVETLKSWMISSLRGKLFKNRSVQGEAANKGNVKEFWKSPKVTDIEAK